MAIRTLVSLLCVLTSAGCYRTDDPSGSGSGGSTTSSPTVIGLARYQDIDRSGTPNAGDRIVVPFDAPVSIATTDVGALQLAVVGDLFGTGATLVSGPRLNEITILLGDGASLKTRQAYTPGQTQANSASGIDVAASIASGAITHAQTGATVEASLPIDIVPALVAGPMVATGHANAIARADLDIDGIQDLVLALATGGFEVSIGNGDGTFESGFTSGAAVALSIAIGDLDNDGRADVIIGTEGNDQVWLGNGSPIFTGSTTLPVLEPTAGLALADLDRDGDLDIIAAGADALRVHRNDGSGAFPSEPASYGTGPSAVVAADFDRDGDIDVLAAHDGANRLWNNDGMGNLTPGPALGNAATLHLAVADVDLDGDLDFVASNQGADRLWLGNGAGQFEIGQTFPAGDPGPLEFGDLDQDARPDLFVSSAHELLVFLNRGGSFELAERLASGATNGLVTGDWNCDGDLDLAAATPISGIALLEGSLAGTWGTSTLHFGEEAVGTGGSFSLTAEDIDRDGDLDLAAGKDARAELLLNAGAGAFGDDPLPVSILAGKVTDMVFADVDSDGDRDLVLTRREGLLVFLNDGSGDFTGLEPTQVISSLSAFGVALAIGDVDSDGDLDAVIGNLDRADTLFLNPGVGPGGWPGFAQPVRLPQASEIPVRTRTSDLGLADVDADGDLDLILVQGTSGPARIYRNDGAGMFIDTDEQLDTGGARSLAISDIDLDGDQDLVIGTEFDGVVPWRNDGNGRFIAGRHLSSGYMRRVALRDLDGDKYPELLALRGAASGLDPVILFWHGEGGAFSETATAVAPHDGQALTFGDFDLDGDIDVVFGFAPLEMPDRPYWNR
ncbi:MAG: adhesin/invasin [Chlamydiales bacterium]|jgi:adhesin/invasin